MKKLSIITINYNNLEGLRKTIESVLCQTWKDFEWIIIDGGSTDGSKELIEKTASECPNISYWCSEPDKGIYNAMNKGVLQANGEYLQFLNSGDILVSDGIVEEFLQLPFTEDIITGHVCINGNIEDVWHTVDEHNVDYKHLADNTILHPSSYIKKRLFMNYGMYDEHLKIVSDWKFFLTCLILHNCTYRKWDKVIVDFNTNGISENPDSQDLLRSEREQVLNSFLPRVYKTYVRQKEEIKELGLKRRIKRVIVDRLFSLFKGHGEG